MYQVHFPLIDKYLISSDLLTFIFWRYGTYIEGHVVLQIDFPFCYIPGKRNTLASFTLEGRYSLLQLIWWKSGCLLQNLSQIYARNNNFYENQTFPGKKKKSAFEN